MQRKLTDPFIRKLKPGPKRIEVRDTLLPGFGIRVSPKGKKTHFVCCRVYGKQKRVQLGHYPAVTLADARKRAREILECPEALIDEKPAMTVDQALDLYFKLYVATHIKHPRDQESRLKRKFGSQFGHRDLESIKKPEIVAILDTIMAEGAPTQANRVLYYLHRFFGWCVERGYIEINPAHGIRKPAKEIPRDRYLDHGELASVYVAAGDLGFPLGTFAQILILTGQRRGEVAGMRWSEIDLDAKLWNLPSSRAKNGRAHTIPLSSAAIEILRSMPRFLRSDFVFTTTGESGVSGFGKLKCRLDAATGVTDWRLHDLRRTAATGMAEMGIEPHVVEKILNHSSGKISGVAAVYNRFDYRDEMREALEQWASEVLAGADSNRLTSTSVVPRGHIGR